MGDAVRFSMNEWKPELVYNKLQRIGQELTTINEERAPLVNRKRELELSLNDLNVQLKNTPFSDPEYNKINSRRGQVVKQKGEVEIELSKLKQKATKIQSERDSAQLDLKKKPNEAVKENLLELRDKYLSFSADTTRVSSMRAMSSRFVEEIQIILKLVL